MSETDLKTEEKKAEEAHPLVHTYQSDLSKAMDATEVGVVQKLMAEARAREKNDKDKQIRKKQKGWYTLGSMILIILAIAATIYGIYYYKHLTVKVVENVSVGVFPVTEPISISGTDIRGAIKILTEETTLTENKPTIVNLVSDGTTLGNITNSDFFKFIESGASEPFINTIALPKLGIMNNGTDNTPFIILSVKDPEIAAKEFLIAEPQLLNMFYRSLNINISEYSEEIGSNFNSSYMYNLPVRTLSVTDGANPENKKVILFYGSVNNNIVVITTHSEVLKAIYDSVIRQ